MQQNYSKDAAMLKTRDQDLKKVSNSHFEYGIIRLFKKSVTIAHRSKEER